MILITGANGQLGRTLCSQAQAIGLGRAELDVADRDSVFNAIGQHQPEVVVNCAAYTAVDAAETDQERCFAINSEGVKHLAEACARFNAKLIQVSTDYVFGETPIMAGPHVEEHVVAPKGVYAVSKRDGEVHALSQKENLVVRTCGLYAHAGKNFVETMLRLGADRDELSIVNDQLCNPTSTTALSRAIRQLIESNASGIYHVVSGPAVTWFQFASMIFDQSKLSVKLTPITTEQYGAPAPRPRNSALSTEKYSETIGRELPTIAEDLAEYLRTREN